MCVCQVCVKHQHVEAVRKSGDVQAMSDLISELEEDLANTEEDRDVWMLRAQRRWPCDNDPIRDLVRPDWRAC